jgi:hypothetical protein
MAVRPGSVGEWTCSGETLTERKGVAARSPGEFWPVRGLFPTGSQINMD